MSAMQRTKGSTFEREIAAELLALTGIGFKRDLEQVRAAEHGDLIASDPAWPFLIECKRYAAGNMCSPGWRKQATAAATASQQFACVVFRFDRQPVRVSVPMAAIAAAFGGQADGDEWAEITLPGLAYLAGEIMAGRAVIAGNETN